MAQDVIRLSCRLLAQTAQRLMWHRGTRAQPIASCQMARTGLPIPWRIVKRAVWKIHAWRILVLAARPVHRHLLLPGPIRFIGPAKN